MLRQYSVGEAVGTRVGLGVGPGVVGAGDGAVEGDRVGGAVGETLGLRLGAVVGILVGPKVGCTVGGLVGAVVGWMVGDIEGKAVGCTVGPLVGCNVGCIDGKPVGEVDGIRVGIGVENCGMASRMGISSSVIPMTHVFVLCSRTSKSFSSIKYCALVDQSKRSHPFCSRRQREASCEHHFGNNFHPGSIHNSKQYTLMLGVFGFIVTSNAGGKPSVSGCTVLSGSRWYSTSQVDDGDRVIMSTTIGHSSESLLH